MRFIYCPHCGRKLEKREIGDEGLLPYCADCETPFWELFGTCIIAAVVNEQNEIALLRQSYVSGTKHVCVAGYIKPGESAEETAIREIREETGLSVRSLEYIGTYPYPKKELLMIGYKATVKKEKLVLSQEVDAAEWFRIEDAPDKLREGSIAWQLVRKVAADLKSKK